MGRLERYVHDKFGFPPTTSIRMASSELVGTDCYRRMKFRSEGNLARMRTELYLTPEERFLSRELMGSTVDPSVQNATEQRQLREKLTNGRFPASGDPGASHIITVVSDFQCSFCKQQATILGEVF